MTFLNYRYNLNTGETYSYQIQSSTGSTGSLETVYTGSAGSFGSSGSVSSVGSVGQLSLNTILNLYETGNLTAEELVQGIQAHGGTNPQRSESGNKVTYSFSIYGKNYTISCTKAAEASQVDYNTVKVYTLKELTTTYKLSLNAIAEYFDAVQTENGQGTKYAIKADSPYKTLGEIQKAVEAQIKKSNSADENESQVKKYIDIDWEASEFWYDVFAGKNNIDSSYLTETYKLWSNFDDFGLGKEMYDLIKDTMKKLNICNTYDEKYFFEALIKRINNHLGTPNTNPPILTKNSVSNNVDFSVIKNILNSNEFLYEYYLGSVDGIIESYSQGSTGDCWLLSGLSALGATEKGKKTIKDSIKDNGDRTYTVTFAAINYSCTVTYEDIVEARAIPEYSRGDTDALILELALEKYLLFKSGKYDSETGLYNGTEYEKSWIIGPASPYFILTPLTGCIVPEYTGMPVDKILDYQYNNFKNGDTILTFSVPSVQWIKDINGKNTCFVSGHSYAVVDMYKDPHDSTKNTITIVNPWYSNEKIILSWNEYTKLNPHLETYSDKNSIDVDTILKPFENGDMTVDGFKHIVYNLECQGILSDEMKEQISDRIIKLVLEDKLDFGNMEWICKNLLKIKPQQALNSVIKNLVSSKNCTMMNIFGWFNNSKIISIENLTTDYNFDWSTKLHTMVYEFDSDGKHYKLTEIYTTSDEEESKKEHETYTPDEIFKYTSNSNIINSYFDIAASVDGEPILYRLKTDCLFNDFVTFAASK